MPRTRRNNKRNSRKYGRNNMRKTMTSRASTKHLSNDQKAHVVSIFLEMLNVVKLYHWKTRSYAQHKATDELYSKLNENIDKFVEILLGKDASRVTMLEKRMSLIDSKNVTDFKSRIYQYREFLINDISMYFDSRRDTDLLNVRDEIVGDINQFLYLMTFDK